MKIRTEQRPIENIEVITHRIFQIIGKNIGEEDLRHEILSDPNFPSIQTILNVLEYYNINSIAIKLPIEKLQNIPLPLIVHIKEDLSRFAIIEKIEGEQIYLFHPTKGLIIISLTHFLKGWTGACVVIKASDSKSDSLKSISLKKTIRILTGVSFLSILSIFGINLIEMDISLNNLIVIVFLFLINISGLIFSFFTLLIKLDQFSILSERICKPTKHINCGSVINSNGGKLLGILELPDLSIVFFLTSLTIQLAMLNNYNDYFHIAFIMFSLSIPVIAYSIYYQTIKLHQWCKLCLLIGSLQILGFVTLIFNINRSNFNLYAYTLAAFFGVFAISIYFIFKLIFTKYYKYDEQKIMLARFKKDPKVLYTILENQPSIYYQNIDHEVKLGSDTAQKKILFIGQEKCPLCKAAFKELIKIDRTKFDLQIIIRFIPLEVSDNNPIRKIIKTVITQQKEETARLVNSFFGVNEYENEDIDINSDSDSIENTLNTYKKWLDASGIIGAPTIFLNDHKIPLGFEIEDIITLLKN